MANPTYSTILVTFEAAIQRSKDRLIAVPAAAQRRLGLERRADNHLICYSIRHARQGRWNRHIAKLTFDNEFSIPSDVVHLKPGDEVEVKVHRVVADVAVEPPAEGTAADVLVELAAAAAADPRIDGSDHVDDYLAGEIAS